MLNTAAVVRDKRLLQVKIGQGEGDTKWKGCAWKALLLMFDIICYIVS